MFSPNSECTLLEHLPSIQHGLKELEKIYATTKQNFEMAHPESMEFHIYAVHFFGVYTTQVCFFEHLKNTDINIPQEILDESYLKLGKLTTIHSRAAKALAIFEQEATDTIKEINHEK